MRGFLGGMLHSVGCPQPSADNWAARWDRPTARVCPTYVTEPGVAIQILPEDKRPWTSGSGPNGNANDYMFQVEMAEPGCLKYGKGGRFTVDPSRLAEARQYVIDNYWTAVELFADVFKRHDLDPLAKIKGKNHLALISHAEGAKAGVASNHGDPEHLWRQLQLPFSMDTFRHDVKIAMAGGTKPAPMPPAEGKRVEVITPRGLNVRQKATTASKRLRTLPAGMILEIKEEQKGWGYAPSEKGWINLGSKYVKVLKPPEQDPTPPSPPSPAPEPEDKVATWAVKNELKKTDEGPLVEVVQATLMSRGYDVILIDGKFGSVTEKQINELKADHGLPIDGVIDSQTWEVLLR